MNIWHKFIIKCFPFNSIDEYNGAKEIHISELKTYRKQWQFVLGIILFSLPFLYLFYIFENWFHRSLLLLMVFGEICIRDTITEHFCLKLYREKKE